MIRRSFIFFLLLFLLPSISGFAEEPADVDYRKKDYASARELYDKARAGETNNPERWLQFSAQIVRCCTALGDSDRAAQEFFVICRVDPQTTLFDCIPLPWNPPVAAPGAPTALEKTAEEFLDPLKHRDPGQAAVLLAAGILSVSAQRAGRDRGLARLDQLSKTEGPAAQLAAALLWKQKLPILRTTNELAFLETAVEKIPEPLRAGPYFLLGRAAHAVGEREKAVLYWMRLPILYPENKLLVEAAVNEAAATLEKLGRPDQAARIRSLTVSPATR